ncbi:hypothetical protein Syun_017571 [Stephania yunnanensis]|uniref:Uncharacterized protein n=1 Tax=Stephania yunnanensis TaxID=152371 RepID=A0AAP0J758_9MAGN
MTTSGGECDQTRIRALLPEEIWERIRVIPHPDPSKSLDELRWMFAKKEAFSVKKAYQCDVVLELDSMEVVQLIGGSSGMAGRDSLVTDIQSMFFAFSEKAATPAESHRFSFPNGGSIMSILDRRVLILSSPRVLLVIRSSPMAGQVLQSR